MRRLLHLQTTAPAEKALIFSQFPEALKLVALALQTNGIKFVQLLGGRQAVSEPGSRRQLLLSSCELSMLCSSATLRLYHTWALSSLPASLPAFLPTRLPNHPPARLNPPLFAHPLAWPPPHPTHGNLPTHLIGPNPTPTLVPTLPVASPPLHCPALQARKAVAAFREDEEVRVFLLSHRAGAAGLTLVRANHVFLLEPALEPAIEQQAVARVHRIGQQRCVWGHAAGVAAAAAVPAGSPLATACMLCMPRYDWTDFSLCLLLSLLAAVAAPNLRIPSFAGLWLSAGCWCKIASSSACLQYRRPSMHYLRVQMVRQRTLQVGWLAVLAFPNQLHLPVLCPHMHGCQVGMQQGCRCICSLGHHVHLAPTHVYIRPHCPLAAELATTVEAPVRNEKLGDEDIQGLLEGV